MKFYGVTNLHSPDEPGIHQYPETGFITITLNKQYKLSPKDYCIGIPYIIANNPSNQIYLMPVTSPENTRSLNTESSVQDTVLPLVDKVLSIEFVEELPSTLDKGTAYILNIDGFQSSFYISSTLEDRVIKYRLMARSSVITTDILDAMLPVGEIKGLLFRVDNNRWLKPCDGTILSVPADEYPLYTALIRDSHILREEFITVDNKTGLLMVKIPDLTNAFPVFSKNAELLAGFITNSNTAPGQVFKKSTMAKVAFNHKEHQHDVTVSKITNSWNVSSGGLGTPFNYGSENFTTAKLASEVNLDSPNIKHLNKVQVSEGVIAPPHTPLIPHIVIR